MKEKNFLKGAAILGIAGILVQIMGAFFRIPLGNIIGDEGMGYYQTAYPIYVFLLVFSTNGAPAAISKMTSERIAKGNNYQAYRVFKLSFILMFLLGILAWAIVYFLSENIVESLNNPKAYYAMKAIAPALFFVPIMAVFRGYFQGMQNMTPTAISQLIEQAIRVIIGLILAFTMLKYGHEYAAAGATLGTSIGPILGLLSLIFIYKKSRIRFSNEEKNINKQESAKSILSELALISIPITIGVSIIPVMNLSDVIVVMGRLQKIGFTVEQSNELYGQLTGMAGPVINIPMALALSMALSIVPAVASSIGTNDKKSLENNLKLGFRTSVIIGVPCSFGIMALAEPIMMLLYPNQIESAVNASESLYIMGIGVIFLCIAQTMAGVLQGIGKPFLSVLSLILGFIVKSCITYILTGIPELNINGAAIGSTVGFAVVCIINFIAVKRYTEVYFDFKNSFAKPFLSGVVMYIFVYASYLIFSKFVGNNLSTIISIGVGGITYVVALVKSKSINEDEIKEMPKGKLLVKTLKKIKIL